MLDFLLTWIRFRRLLLLCRTCQIMRQWSVFDSAFLDLFDSAFLNFIYMSRFVKCPKLVNRTGSSPNYSRISRAVYSTYSHILKKINVCKNTIFKLSSRTFHEICMYVKLTFKIKNFRWFII